MRRESALPVTLGEELVVDGNTMFPPDKQQLLTKGRLWFDNKKKYISKKICKDGKVKEKLLAEEGKGRVEYISALIDLIGTFSLGISPVLLSVILIKYNISKLCEECQDEEK